MTAAATQPTGRLLTLQEVAAYLGVPDTTLYRWRHHGGGPRGMRVGKYVRYRPGDVEAWLDTCTDPERAVS